MAASPTTKITRDESCGSPTRDDVPIYDERLLPVLYSSIGISAFGELLSCHRSINHATTSGVSYWRKESNTFGVTKRTWRISPGHPLPLPPPSPPSPIFRHFFRYASSTSRILSPGQAMTILLETTTFSSLRLAL